MCSEVHQVCGALATIVPLLVETMWCSAVHLAGELGAGGHLWDMTQSHSQLRLLQNCSIAAAGFHPQQHNTRLTEICQRAKGSSPLCDDKRPVMKASSAVPGRKWDRRKLIESRGQSRLWAPPVCLTQFTTAAAALFWQGDVSTTFALVGALTCVFISFQIKVSRSM